MYIPFRNFVLIGLTGLCFSIHQARGQSDKNNIDSIRAKVQRLSSDTDKVTTLLDRVSDFDCDDSLKKILLATDAKQMAENIKWRPGIIKANRILGKIFITCEKNRDKALEYFQMNVDLAIRNKDVVNEILALEVIGREYDDQHQPQKSIEYYNKVLELKPALETQANILGNIGIEYEKITDYKTSLIYFDSSLKLISSKKAPDLQDSVEMAALHLNIGDLYLTNQNPDKAFTHYQQVLNSSAAKSDKVLKILSLIGMGRAYKLKKDYQHAIEHYQLALQECRGNNRFAEEVKIKDELANTYLETWQLPQALAYADSALSLAEGQHFLNLLSQSNATMGSVYIRQNHFDLAIDYLRKALEIAKQTDNLEDQRDALGSLAKAYYLSKQYEQAYNAQLDFHMISDSLYNIEKANDFTKSELSNEFRRKRFEDSVTTAVTFNTKIKQQKVLTYSGFVALVLVILLAFFMYRSYVTQKKYNDLLAIEKKRHLAHIEAQSNILSDIADTQAHKIRGPISTILGLVHIFNYDDLTDPMNKQVMEWITSTTEKLDATVKDVIIRENSLRNEHADGEDKPTE